MYFAVIHLNLCLELVRITCSCISGFLLSAPCFILNLLVFAEVLDMDGLDWMCLPLYHCVNPSIGL